MHVVAGDAARTHEKFEPARAAALGVGFAAAQEVAFRQHADQGALLVDHRQPADVMLQHQARGLQHGRILVDRDARCGS